MCYQSERRGCGVSRADGSILLSPKAAYSLQSAVDRMDLLLRSRGEDAGLRHLVAMLQHLRVVGRETRFAAGRSSE